MKIDEWIAGLQKKPTSSSSPEYYEGCMLHDLVQEYARERQEQQWNKILADIRQSGLLEADNNSPLSHSTTITAPLSPIGTASNEPRFLWVAASMVALTAIGGVSAYLFLSQPSHDSAHNAYYSTEGLIRMRGASQKPQFILVPKGSTPKQVAVQVEEILKHYNIPHEPPFEASGGRIQFIAAISNDSPVRAELKKIGIDVAVNPNGNSSEVEVIVNFVLIQIPMKNW